MAAIHFRHFVYAYISYMSDIINHMQHELYILVPPVEATMSKMVIKQPQPVMEAQESDEWGSGICDCCDDVPECKCLYYSDRLSLTPVDDQL